MRLDQYVSEEKKVSRSKAQDLIKAQLVFVNNKVIEKNAYEVKEDDIVLIKEEELPFASRGAFKLYHALQAFHVDLTDKVCLDVGASTGGFSDVCLHFNAKKVYAVDAGKDQLIDRLKNDERIVNIEEFNAKNINKEMFDDDIDFICMDVSFISIKNILPVLFPLLDNENKEAIVLIKPQFEAGKKYIGKKGIIKDYKVHKMVLKDIVTFVLDHGYFVAHLAKSEMVGRDGNQEFLMHITKKKKDIAFDYNKIVKK